MGGNQKSPWRGPWAVALYVMAASIAGLVALAVRAGRQAADRQRAAQVPPPIPSSSGGTPLEFGRASLVAGTAVMRVDLIRRGSGFEYSSGSYGEVRNVLFLDPGAKMGRWLLPDADHAIAESVDIEREETPGVKRLLAVAALVKPLGGDLRVVDGRLIVFDPTAKVVESLSDGVRTLHVAAMGQGLELVVMYERQRKFVVATLDPQTLKARSEQLFDIPSLN